MAESIILTLAGSPILPLTMASFMVLFPDISWDVVVQKCLVPVVVRALQRECV